MATAKKKVTVKKVTKTVEVDEFVDEIVLTLNHREASLIRAFIGVNHRNYEEVANDEANSIREALRLAGVTFNNTVFWGRADGIIVDKYENLS